MTEDSVVVGFVKEMKTLALTKTNYVCEYKHREQEGQGCGCAACFL